MKGMGSAMQVTPDITKIWNLVKELNIRLSMLENESCNYAPKELDEYYSRWIFNIQYRLEWLLKKLNIEEPPEVEFWDELEEDRKGETDALQE